MYLYARQAVAVIVYDITNRKSFENIRSWFEDVKKERGSEAFLVILGNKADLVEERTVTKEEAELLAKEIDCQLF